MHGKGLDLMRHSGDKTKTLEVVAEHAAQQNLGQQQWVLYNLPDPQDPHWKNQVDRFFHL